MVVECKHEGGHSTDMKYKLLEKDLSITSAHQAEDTYMRQITAVKRAQGQGPLWFIMVYPQTEQNIQRFGFKTVTGDVHQIEEIVTEARKPDITLYKAPERKQGEFEAIG